MDKQNSYFYKSVGFTISDNMRPAPYSSTRLRSRWVVNSEGWQTDLCALKGLPHFLKSQFGGTYFLNLSMH